MLQSYSQIGREFGALKLPILKIPELFLSKKLERYPERRPSFKKSRPQSDTVAEIAAASGFAAGFGGDSPSTGSSRHKRKNTLDSMKQAKKSMSPQSTQSNYSVAATVRDRFIFPPSSYIPHHPLQLFFFYSCPCM